MLKLIPDPKQRHLNINILSKENSALIINMHYVNALCLCYYYFPQGTHSIAEHERHSSKDVVAMQRRTDVYNA